MPAQNPLQAAGQWTVTQFYTVVNKLAEDANREASNIKANTHKIAELFTKARAVPDATLRAQSLATLEPLSRRQAAIVLDHKGFVTKFRAMLDNASRWLRSIGITAPTVQLNGLGIVPAIVPIAIATVVAALVAFIAREAFLNAQVAKEIAAKDRAYQDMMDGKLTADQYRAVNDNIDKTIAATGANAPGANDPLGLGKLVPLAIAVAAILILPRVLDLLPKSKAAA